MTKPSFGQEELAQNNSWVATNRRKGGPTPQIVEPTTKPLRIVEKVAKYYEL
jgi:hypothetical protein